MGCRNSGSEEKVLCLSCDVEEEMQKAGIELQRFDQQIIDLYIQAQANPQGVISKTHMLIQKIKAETDSNNVRRNKLALIRDLRIETFYRMKQYQQSIAEINEAPKYNLEDFSLGDGDYVHLACNYVKLKDFKKARQCLDRVSKNWYNTDFIWANYNEVIGNRAEAISGYRAILEHDDYDHYFYFKDAQQRAEQLSKPGAILLTELFYPSDRPDNEICKTDNLTRNKIFEMIDTLAEVKACRECNGLSIYQEPKQTKSSKYWIKVISDHDGNSITKFNFFVDTATFYIIYLDMNSNRQLTLGEWRNLHK